MDKYLSSDNPIEYKGIGSSAMPEVGILEWFHINDYNHVKQAVVLRKELGIKYLRTGISWADYFTDHGENWYHWLIPYLSEHFEYVELWNEPNTVANMTACTMISKV